MLISDPFRSFDQVPAPFFSLRPGLFPFLYYKCQMGEGNKLCILLKASLKKKSVPDIYEREQTLVPIPKMVFFLKASLKKKSVPDI